MQTKEFILKFVIAKEYSIVCTVNLDAFHTIARNYHHGLIKLGTHKFYFDNPKYMSLTSITDLEDMLEGFSNDNVSELFNFVKSQQNPVNQNLKDGGYNINLLFVYLFLEISFFGGLFFYNFDPKKLKFYDVNYFYEDIITFHF